MGIKKYLSETLPDYMIPSYFMNLERIPLTPNGKLNRKLLPEPDMGALTAYYTAPRDPVEKRLAGVWQAILQVDRIGIDDHFFQLGGHSLKAIILISRIHKAFQIDVPLAEIFRTPTIRGLSDYIKSKEQGLYASIEPVEEKDYHALSPAQKRLYILHQMDESSTSYNMPFVSVLEGGVNKHKFEEVFLTLIARHKSLQTSFRMLAGVPVQRIHQAVDFEIEYYELGREEGIIQNFIRPFDLSHAPLLRVGLVKKAEERHLLVVDMHHIISDGISRRVLVREFMALAAGKDLPPLRLQYKDFSGWQTREAQRKELIKQKAYWKKQLAGEIPVLDLPIDYVRPSIQRFEGSTVTFEIDREEVNALQSLALAEGITLYMILLAIYYILLSKLSNQEDLLVGTPTVGRRHADLEQMIGMFVNTLVLRNYPSGEKTYRGFLTEIKKRSLQAFENQDYPYEELVEEVAITRDASRNPLFDTMFVMQNLGIPRIEIPGLKVAPYEQPGETSKFDLTLIGMEVEEKLSLNFEYSSNLFKKDTIERFTTYFKKIVSSVVDNADVKICDLEILVEEEKRQVLYDFNNTTADYPRDKTLHELFEEQVERTPDNIAVMGPMVIKYRTYMTYMTYISYRELNEKSNQLAYRLRSKAVVPDTIVGIMVERSLEMIIGILGILKAGGAYLPIDLDYPGERINYMLADSSANLVVTTRTLAEEDGKIGKWKNRNNIEILLLDFSTLLPFHPAALPSSHLHQSPCVNAPAASLAYIIYTSGTTGKPKGTLTTHTNVIRVVKNTNYIDLTAQDRVLQLSNYAFDGSVFDIYGALLNGAVLVMIEKESILSVDKLSQVITRDLITVFFVTTALFNALTDLDIRCLSRIRKVLFGGERISVEHSKQALEHLSKDKIIHVYGPTETTVYATYYPINRIDETRETIPIGSPISNTTTYILDKYGQLVPIGVYGELFIGGDGIARGYLNKAELTGENFIPDTFTPGERLYRSGDMVRWLDDGSIEFIGRVDHQVKIRGFRVETGEIEHQLLQHNKINETVVVAREDMDNTDRVLCAYVVSDEKIEVSQLRDFLEDKLPGYMIPAYFVWLDKFPLTPNGKINRKALPVPVLEPGDRYVAPGSRIEKKLVEIWWDVLVTVAHAPVSIGIDDNFFQLGGHSLKATLLISKIHKALHVKVPLAEIFKNPTIRELCKYIEAKEKDRYTSIKKTGKKEYYRLSSAQKRLYFLQQMDLESTAYNIPSALILEGILEKAKLEDAFKKLIYRHESLRTFFEMIDDEPIQGVRDVVDFEIEYYDLKEVKVEVEEKHLEGTRGLAPLPTKNFIRPFDLSQTPLFRVGLTEVEEEKHLLMVDMHHIISDGMSGGILVRDFVGLYSGNTLPAMRFQYKDYAQWQNQEKESIRVQDQARYWQKQFEEEIPVLDLPTDDVRPGVQRFEGSRLSFEISSETTDALKALALEEGATLYMVLLAIYTIFLAKISNQEDIVIGAPVAGRRHADLEKIIGMFVNTLAMRHYPTGEKTFIRFLAEVKERTLQAFENQEYQYEDLVEQVVVNRDVSRNPLFDASFLLQNIEVPQLAIPGLKFIPYEYETVTSKFDLTLNGIEVEEKLLLSFEYSTNLFKKATIERFATYLKKIVSSVVDNAEVKICDLEILVQEEKKKLLYDFNNTTAEYPEDKTIHELFAEQVERTPDNIAVMGPVVIKDRTYMTYMTYISYRELNEKSNQLASRLRSKAVVPESIVAIMVERSIEMIVGILGILKAGGAYLPIDPDSPEERIKFMLADSNAKILLTSREIPNLSSPEAYNNSLKGTPSHLQPTPVTAVSSSSTLTSTLTCQVSPANLAYVIYTSGSTGRPKGVMIRHKSVVNFIKGMTDIIDFTRNSTILSLTTISFDIFVLETLLPLSTGSKVVVGTNDQQRNPEAAAKILGNQLVTILQVTPSRLTLLISADQSAAALKPLKYLLVGGEAFPEQLLEKAREITTGEIYNLYGPTETTIWSTVKNVSIGKSLNIGKPIINTRIYILGKNSTLQPIGIVGDLYIGGDGLARGYVNNPGLTAEKFDHDLWDFQDDQDKKKKIPGKNHMQSCNHASMQYHSPTPQYPITPLPHSPIYQTSDLARWLWDGNIEFLGRIDHQVKIRGNRIELGEIECQLLQHPEVKEAVVLAKEDEIGDSDRYLAAYIVSECDVSVLVSQLREYLSKVLPGYMMPSYFVPIDKIPLTSSGKIHRRALPAPGAKTYGEYIAPGDEIEEALSEIWSLVLGTKKELIGIEDNFFHLGGHSLKATTLVLKIHKVFNVKLPLVEIFKRPTIRGLSQYIRHAVKEKYTPIEVTEQKEYYPLSSAQKRLYILQQMELGGTAYNMPEFIPLQMDSHLTKIEETFKKLINRHENFRTSYYMVKDEPVQRIHEEVEFQLEYYDASPGEVVDIGKKFVRAFDLSQAPLLRVGLAAHQGESSGNSYILLVDMHHIISDGVSHQILVKDFITSYREEELPLLRIQYKDFSQWQNSERKQEKIKSQEEYWLKEFAGEIPVLELPTDYPRPAFQDFAGSVANFEISADETAMLKQIALSEGSTMFMVLLAIFNILLSKLSSQEDIVVGTPIAGRRHADLEKIIGMFVNTLALRSFPAGEQTFLEFLKKVKEATLKAFENQEYQFEDLVESVEVNRDVSRNPIFDVMFSLQNMMPETASPSNDTTDVPAGNQSDRVSPVNSNENIPQSSKFDLTLSVMAGDRKLFFLFRYCTKLFKEETIRKFINYFIKITSIIVKDPLVKISAVQLISGEEKKQLLYDFNDTGARYPGAKTIHCWFREQLVKWPGHIALVGPMYEPGHAAPRGHGAITYRQLNTKSHRLAALLRSKGIGPGSIVAIINESCIEMMVEIFGVLKSGSAYLPLDPQYPPERINYILKDSQSQLLLTRPHLVRPGSIRVETLNSEDTNTDNRLYKTGVDLPPENSGPDDPVYMIYTSGTSGKPKGVVLKHSNLVNYVNWFCTEIRLTTGDKSVLTSSFAFDLGYTSIYPPLLVGGQLHLLPKETYMSAENLLDYICLEGISYLKMTPSLFSPLVSSQLFTRETCRSLRWVVLGGEAINTADVEKAYGICRHLKIMNHYGPTEVTIGCIAQLIDPNRLEEYKIRPTIGKPIFNTRVYILDKHLNLLPMGIAGELGLSGIGVARGYFKQESLTAERFIVNPFVEPVETDRPYDRIYRTGDLARWLKDGNIEFLGRIDLQIKIRGYRVELGEIENQLLSHEEIKDVVVMMKADEGGDKYLCAYMVSVTPPTQPQLIEFLSAKLPGYMVPSYFVFLDAIPLTPNGKIDRKALPEPGLGTGGAKYTAPKNETEEKLVEIWSELLVLEKEKISTDVNFFQLGGHSLKATIMISKVHKEFNVRMPLAELFKSPTIRGMSEYLKASKQEKYRSIKPSEKRDYYVLSSAQKRLFILDRVEENINMAYNLPTVMHIEGSFHKQRFEDAVQALVRRHEALRTSFHLVDGKPVQKIHEKVEYEIEYYDLTGTRVEVVTGSPQLVTSTIKNFIRPFDLTHVPLLRVGLVLMAEDRHLFLLDLHHIISDGVSEVILIRELIDLYEGSPLPELPLQYKDYSQWQTSRLKTGEINRQKDYWLNRFSGKIPILNLHTDYQRQATQVFQGDNIRREIGPGLTGKIKDLTMETDTTLFMVLLAAWYILLSKYTNHEDITVGIPAAGRNHPDLEHIAGMFVNTLGMRNYPGKERNFADFLQEVKTNALEDYENQDYPFDDLVNQLDIPRNSQRNPLFDILFVSENIDMPELTVKGLQFRPYSFEHPITHMDLVLYFNAGEETIHLILEYSTALFKPGTARQMLDHYVEILEQVMEDREIALKEIVVSHDYLIVRSTTLTQEDTEFDF